MILITPFEKPKYIRHTYNSYPRVGILLSAPGEERKLEYVKRWVDANICRVIICPRSMVAHYRKMFPDCEVWSQHMIAKDLTPFDSVVLLNVNLRKVLTFYQKVCSWLFVTYPH